MSIDYNDFRLSKIASHPKYGSWWAVGTHKEWFEFRITKGGQIRLFRINKGKHPYFTKDKFSKDSK